MSSSHFELRITSTGIAIKDLGSRNGTYLNGVPISLASLGHGDRFGVGKTEFLLECKSITDREVELDSIHADQLVGVTSTCGASGAGSPNAESLSSGQPQGCELDTHFAPEIPHHVGAYTLDRLIGQGGMGVVYRAIDDRDQSEVAIKFIRSDRARSSKSDEVFKREAAILAQLQHPRIIRGLDHGWIDQTPYLVMEYKNTIDLLKLIDSQAPVTRARTAIWAASRLIEALHYLHSQGVVHRDVKPGNVIAYREAHRLQIKLSDFGLAKFYELAGQSNLTNDKSIRGTVAYMSPEQFRDSLNATPSDDVYSCGAFLFRCLVGSPPNGAVLPRKMETLLQGSELPVQQKDFLRRALHPDPAARFASCKAFAHGLAQIKTLRSSS